jgi:hypothetical protein
MVMINGLGRGTTSMFSSPISVGQSYGLAGAVMGQTTPYQWYQTAKSEVANFDRYLNGAARIANKTARDEVLAWVGKSGTEGTPAYKAGMVISDLAENVEAFTPPNYDAYQLARRRNRITELADVNKVFSSKVKAALAQYGELPEPVVIERVITTRGADTVKEVQGPWVVPVAIGAALVGVFAIYTLFKGK